MNVKLFSICIKCGQIGTTNIYFVPQKELAWVLYVYLYMIWTDAAIMDLLFIKVFVYCTYKVIDDSVSQCVI